MAPQDAKPVIKYQSISELPDPLFYSHSVSLEQANRLVFTSGILGQNQDGTFPESIDDQIKLVYQNVESVLIKSGGTPQDVIKATFYCVDYSPDQGEALIRPFVEFLMDGKQNPHRPITTMVPVPKLAYPGAKLEVEVVAAIGGRAVPYAVPSILASEKGAPPRNVDVVVVGGGFSGIQAAWDVQKAGLSCVVLEASHRIGGRSRSQKLQSGPGIIELGATWINRTLQPKVYATAKRLGLETVEQYIKGDVLYQLRDGTTMRVAQNSPEQEKMDRDGHRMKEILESACQKVDIHRPDTYPTKLDISLDRWADAQGLSDEIDQDFLRFFLYVVLGRDQEDVGSHYFLDYVKSCQGWDSLSKETEEGAQHLKIKQGTSAIATGLADEMKPNTVFLHSGVDNIHQDEEGALVQTVGGESIQCQKVILAIPTNTYSKIHFTPSLPASKKHLVSRTKPGILAKMIVTYRSAWWKDLGLMGKFISLKEPMALSLDISDSTRQQYSLAIFIGGNAASRWAQLNELQREESVIEQLADIVGPENAHLARDVLEVNYMDWPAEEWLGGAPTSVMGPGLLSKHGASLREPFQNVHIAGGETAYEWKGYLEGALLAGSRAAAEVIEALSSPPAKLANGSAQT